MRIFEVYDNIKVFKKYFTVTNVTIKGHKIEKRNILLNFIFSYIIINIYFFLVIFIILFHFYSCNIDIYFKIKINYIKKVIKKIEK